MNKLFVFFATMVLSFAPSLSHAEAILEGKTVSKFLHLANTGTRFFSGGGTGTFEGVYLVQTTETMENPDGCGRSDYYITSGSYGGTSLPRNNRVFSVVDIDLILAAKINNLSVDFKISGCSQDGFPVIRWFMLS